MSNKILPFKTPKQRALAHVAEAVEANADDLFPDDAEERWEDYLPDTAPGVGVNGVALAAIVAAMVAEAARTGESIRHLEHGCSMRLRIRDDRRVLAVWRNLTTLPSLVELRTLRTLFVIPFSIMPSWEMHGAQKCAVLRWSVAQRFEVYEDREAISDIHAMVERGEYGAAYARCNDIHGNLDQFQVLERIQAAEKAAKEAEHAL